MLYENTIREHSLEEAASSKLVIVTIDSGLKSESNTVATVGGNGNQRTIARLYSQRQMAVAISTSPETFEADFVSAKAERVGLYFPETCEYVENAKAIASWTVVAMASKAGYPLTLTRAINSIARQVPHMKSIEEAKSELRKAFPECEEFAVASLDKKIFSIRSSLKKFSKINRSLVSSLKVMKNNKPCPESEQELKAMAAEMCENMGVYAVKANPGIGKTKHLIGSIAKFAMENNLKIGVMSPRRSMERNVVRDISSYKDSEIIGKEDKLMALSVVINSSILESIRAFFDKVDVLILDEFELLVRHITHGTVQNRVEVLDYLIQCIKSAKLVVATDAFLNDVSLNVLGFAGKKIKMFMSRPDNSNINASVGSIASALRGLMQSILSGKTTFVGTDSRELAEGICKFGKNNDAKTLLITAKTNDLDEVVAFLKNPSEECKKYSLVVFSPTMQSSTSIETGHFENCFALLFGNIIINDIKQLIRRDRTATSITIGVDHNRNYNLRSDELIYERNRTGDARFDSISNSVSTLVNRQRSNIKQYLFMALQEDLYGVSILDKDDELDKVAMASFKISSEEVVVKRAKSVFAAAVAVAKSKGEIQQVAVLATKEADIHFNEMVELGNVLNLDAANITEEVIKDYDEGRIVPRINKFLAWNLSDEAFAKFSESDKMKVGIDKENYGIIRTHLTALMTILGLQKDGSGTMNGESVSLASDYIMANQDYFRMYGMVKLSDTKLLRGFKIEVETSKEKYALIDNVLGVMGLKKSRTMKNGELAHKIDKDALGKIKKYSRVDVRNAVEKKFI